MTSDLAFPSCDTGVLKGSLPACVPIPCTYMVPSAGGLEHNCTNATAGDICQAWRAALGFEYASAALSSTHLCAVTCGKGWEMDEHTSVSMSKYGAEGVIQGSLRGQALCFPPFSGPSPLDGEACDGLTTDMSAP